jgi:hypothetical protein
MILVIGRWRRLCVAFPLEGLVFGAGHRQGDQWKAKVVRVVT